MLKRLTLVMAVVALAAVAGFACKGSGSKQVTYRVKVDGRTSEFVGSFLAYFPKDVKTHPGDTIDFESFFTGEPHTVTLGKNVDDVFAIVNQACPGGVTDPACANGIPDQYQAPYTAADAKLPQFLPQGPGDIIQAAGQPCYLSTGDPPADGSACTADQQNQSDFDGTQTYYNSGFLPDGAVFTVKLAKDIAPGTYYYYCLLHREGMSGKIEVVAKDVKVSSAADVKKAGDDEFETMVTPLKAEADKLDTLTADQATAGAFSNAVPEAEVNEFGPKEISIPEGGSVTWTINGPHTISFKVPDDAKNFITKDDKGVWHVNEKALSPADSPPPPDAPGLVDGGAWDGSAFKNSGILLSFGEPAYQYKVTFSKAGTYTYVCIIHPGMGGSVKVGQ